MTMKKMFLSLLIAGICLSSALFWYQSRPALQVQAPELTPPELRQLIQTRNDFYVYFYSPACKDCIKSTPYLVEALRTVKIVLYKMDVKKYEAAKAEFEVPGTPSLFYYQNRKVQRGISGGFQTAGEYLDFFRQGGAGQ